MKALTWQGKRDVRVQEVADPKIEEPTDAIIKITSTAICGSDLHLYEVLGPFLTPGDILGHEPMGVVEEIGAEVTHIAPGDRVVVPFNISCGHCWMCQRRLFAQCEITQVRSQGKGAALALGSHLRGLALGEQPAPAQVTRAAGDVERHDHPVAWSDVGDVGADLLDDAHRLVPQDVPWGEKWSKDLIEMQVRPADRVEVILMIASVGSSIFGSATSCTRTSRLPCQVSAFTV